MITYKDLIDERIREPFKSKIINYSMKTGTLYEFADEIDIEFGLSFILNLFDFNDTVEGFDYWVVLLEDESKELINNIHLN